MLITLYDLIYGLYVQSLLSMHNFDIVDRGRTILNEIGRLEALLQSANNTWTINIQFSKKDHFESTQFNK